MPTLTPQQFNDLKKDIYIELKQHTLQMNKYINELNIFIEKYKGKDAILLADVKKLKTLFLEEVKVLTEEGSEKIVHILDNFLTQAKIIEEQEDKNLLIHIKEQSNKLINLLESMIKMSEKDTKKNNNGTIQGYEYILQKLLEINNDNMTFEDFQNFVMTIHTSILVAEKMLKKTQQHSQQIAQNMVEDYKNYIIEVENELNSLKHFWTVLKTNNIIEKIEKSKKQSLNLNI